MEMRAAGCAWRDKLESRRRHQSLKDVSRRCETEQLEVVVVVVVVVVVFFFVVLPSSSGPCWGKPWEEEDGRSKLMSALQMSLCLRRGALGQRGFRYQCVGTKRRTGLGSGGAHLKLSQTSQTRKRNKRKKGAFVG